jgi:hypothetical protein
MTRFMAQHQAPHKQQRNTNTHARSAVAVVARRFGHCSSEYGSRSRPRVNALWMAVTKFGETRSRVRPSVRASEASHRKCGPLSDIMNIYISFRSDIYFSTLFRVDCELAACVHYSTGSCTTVYYILPVHTADPMTPVTRDPSEKGNDSA